MVMPVTNTLSQTSICPTMPTPPAIMQCRPILVLPEIPAPTCHGGVVANLHVVRDHDLVASSFTPLPITVSESAPRSMVVWHRSTSSPMRTPPICAIFSQTPLSLAKPKPSPRNHRTGLDHYPLTNLHVVVQGDARGQPATVANRAARTNHGIGTDDYLGTDPRLALDHHARTNAGRWVDLGICRHQRRG